MVAFQANVPFDYKKLHTSIEWSLRQLDDFRSARKKFEREAAGHHYGKNQDSTAPNPVNYMELADTIYMQQLASSSPQVAMSTAHGSLKSAAADMALVVKVIDAVREAGRLDLSQFHEVVQTFLN